VSAAVSSSDARTSVTPAFASSLASRKIFSRAALRAAADLYESKDAAVAWKEAKESANRGHPLPSITFTGK